MDVKMAALATSLSGRPYDTDVADVDDAEDGELTTPEEQIRRLEAKLRDKAQRLDELEAAILEDDERLSKLETLERLEAELKERQMIDEERELELRLLQEVPYDFPWFFFWTKSTVPF